MGVILDSSVVIASERRGETVALILEHIRRALGEIELGLSVVSIAELIHGAYRAKTEIDRQRRLSFITELCRDVPVYPVTLEIAWLAGRVEAEQELRGVRLAFEDLLIGVTALHLGFSVATLNVRHFASLPGLPLVQL